MNFQDARYLFLNVGHFIDHMFMLIFAKAAFSAGLAFGLAEDGAYASMIPYGIPSLVLFGACAPLAAHLADKWSRNGMIVVFFIGIGLASIATSFAESVYQIAAGLAALGVFAAIYHPVGIAMVVEGGGNIGWRLGANGVWGNMGVAAAPLITGLILADYNWRLAFAIPGFFAILIGICFYFFVASGHALPPKSSPQEKALVGFAPGWKRALAALALLAAAGGFIFGAMTFLIPRMFEVLLPEVSVDVAVTGALAAIVYAVAAFAQLAVGRVIDRRRIKPVLITLAMSQPILLCFMAFQSNLALFFSTLVAMAFIFGQIPITDALITRYVPDIWRAKVLSCKVMLNLVVGAIALVIARHILASGGDFKNILLVLVSAGFILLAAAILLPEQAAPKTISTAAPAE